MTCCRAIVATLALLLLAAAPAHAFVAPGARIISASDARQEQGDDDTSQVVLSGDGRYAAFTTRARNFFADDDPDPPGRFRFGGLFRRDLATGALELVASGDLRAEADPDTVLTRGAQNPSLSDDGRYVVFSTGYGLVPADTNGNVDVYLRDMTKPIGAAGAYELISARDGGDVPAGYAPMPPELDRPGVNPGSDVTLGHAMSGDARYVAFRTSFIASDLPDAAAPTVGQLQVLVRDREGRRTSLLTRDATTGDPVGSANGGVSLSRDGSTVLWVGLGAAAQTRFLPGELVDPSSQYIFWRRWVDGPSTATRRVTGPSDPDDPGCTTVYVFSLTATGPCYGPLATLEGVQGGLTRPSARDERRRAPRRVHDRRVSARRRRRPGQRPLRHRHVGRRQPQGRHGRADARGARRVRQRRRHRGPGPLRRRALARDHDAQDDVHASGADAHDARPSPAQRPRPVPRGPHRAHDRAHPVRVRRIGCRRLGRGAAERQLRRAGDRVHLGGEQPLLR